MLRVQYCSFKCIRVSSAALVGNARWTHENDRELKFPFPLQVDARSADHGRRQKGYVLYQLWIRTSSQLAKSLCFRNIATGGVLCKGGEASSSTDRARSPLVGPLTSGCTSLCRANVYCDQAVCPVSGTNGEQDSSRIKSGRRVGFT